MVEILEIVYFIFIQLSSLGIHHFYFNIYWFMCTHGLLFIFIYFDTRESESEKETSKMNINPPVSSLATYEAAFALRSRRDTARRPENSLSLCPPPLLRPLRTPSLFPLPPAFGKLELPSATTHAPYQRRSNDFGFSTQNYNILRKFNHFLSFGDFSRSIYFDMSVWP